MAIRITRNNEGNCITFVGSTNPAYWNSCLSAEISSEDPDRLHIINDIRSINGTVEYEFFSVEYTDFADKDNNSFESAQACVDYINANANVLGVSDTGTDMTGQEVSFRLDDTSTSIILDNGHQFGVNTVKAVANTDGTIHIHAIGAGSPNGSEDANDRVHLSHLEVGLAKINGTTIAGGLNDVANALNELFTVGPFEAVVISDPFSTMVADVDGVASLYTLEGVNAIDPAGDDIFTGSTTGNYAGLLTDATINQAGEYFTFDIRGEGQIGFGLVHTETSYNGGNAVGNQSYAHPNSFAVTNSAHYGYQFSHWFHPTPNGSWTNYGASTGYVGGPGWSNNWDQQADWLAGNPVKIKCGIDENGFIAISSLQDDGTWILHSRSSYPVIDGSEFKLGIKSAHPAARVYSAPKVHELEEEAPTLYYRFVESPDGVFNYPLFATAEEAEYVDASDQSSTITFADDPTGTTWYYPTNGYTSNGTAAPTDQTYTEITSLTNSDLAPSAFTFPNLAVAEGDNVNVQMLPAGATFSQSVSISPAGSGFVYNAATGYLQGTAADVGSHTDYDVTVVRANSYGSTTSVFEIAVSDVPPVQTNDTPWTRALHFNGSNEHTKQVNNSMYSQALQMNGLASTVGLGSRSQGETSDESLSRPWATCVVFKSDGYNANQMIWNQGEGNTSGNDNIFLNVTATGNVNFGWGREGTGYNQCRVASGISSDTWYGVYVGHSGERLSGNNATAANLADCFDIRLMSSADSFGSLSANLSSVFNWTNTGYRMDRTVAGDFTVGSRGVGNLYSFRGQVASMIVTTLIGQGTFTPEQQPGGLMYNEAQIEKMITDPVYWMNEYKVRHGLFNTSAPYRGPATAATVMPFLIGPDTGAYNATQMWLMGDGELDSYANGIRNFVYPADQNRGKMQLNNMVSNDIQTVSIPGLS